MAYQKDDGLSAIGKLQITDPVSLLRCSGTTLLEMCLLMISMNFLVHVALPLHVITYHRTISMLSNSNSRISINPKHTTPEFFL